MARPKLFALLVGLIALLAAGNASGQSAYIPNVPDVCQPADTVFIGGPKSNYCAPMAAANITGYWDGVKNHCNAAGVNAGMGPDTAACYLGYFMGTNGWGSPVRRNNPTSRVPGTYTADQDTGFFEFVRWDSRHPYTTPPPAVPGAKKGYTWTFMYMDSTMVPNTVGFNFITGQIDSGRPVKVDFLYWNPQDAGVIYVDPTSGDTIYFYDWGAACSGSGPPDPTENWDGSPDGVGHAVTAVGYFRNFDPDTAGPMLPDNYLVVHDNWGTTVVNVAVAWEHWAATISADPSIKFNISKPVPIEFDQDWGVLAYYTALWNAGLRGICSPPHEDRCFYFPSDTVATLGDMPLAWVKPGYQLATRYGTGNVRLEGCFVDNGPVKIPDRYGHPRRLYVELPPEELIDEPNDLNVIQISSGDITFIGVDDYVETLVLVASCDGYADYPGGPSPDQPLQVELEYDGGRLDAYVIPDIHPAGRPEITSPDVFLYGNELLVCDPAYFDNPYDHYDAAYSEAWHWYVLYPDTTEKLQGICFTGIHGPEGCNDIYILAISYTPSLYGQSGINARPDVSNPHADFLLSSNSPNPFKRTTQIHYSLAIDCHVKLEVYNIQGQKVATLINGRQAAGPKTTRWDAGAEASGIYLLRCAVGDVVKSRKMILLR